ncbi:hypothetical protein ACFWWS_19340 [Streptomyces sp. NPDC059083]|uniref:hypothetical protein n=1 Tax=unclassified Streptomyces TaxID=2593676 RepID=UPI0036958075
MGHSRAYPVFRTTDAAEAYARAERLVALLERVDDTVFVEAEVRTVAEARRVAALLPDPAADPAPPVDAERAVREVDVARAEDAEIRAALPLCVSGDVPLGALGRDLPRALGAVTASMDWHGRWPDDRDTGRPGSNQYDGVQLVLHGEEAEGSEWTPHHTVLVHLDKREDASRARRLAARVDGEVLGDVRIGW